MEKFLNAPLSFAHCGLKWREKYNSNKPLCLLSYFINFYGLSAQRPALQKCTNLFSKECLSQPSQRRPVRADRGKAHLNDVRFNSNWVFFTHDDCLKIDIQYWKSLKIPKFGLTEGVIFNSENCKLSLSQKLQYRQISEMDGENSKIFFA